MSVRVERGVATAVVHAVGHRIPRTIPVSLRTANRLSSAGVPVVVHAPSEAGR